MVKKSKPPESKEATQAPESEPITFDNITAGETVTLPAPEPVAEEVDPANVELASLAAPKPDTEAPPPEEAAPVVEAPPPAPVPLGCGEFGELHGHYSK